MTHEQAVSDILVAFDEYDAGRISRAQFVDVVDKTTAAQYEQGREDERDVADEDDDDEVIFESELELDEEGRLGDSLDDLVERERYERDPSDEETDTD